MKKVDPVAARFESLKKDAIKLKKENRELALLLCRLFKGTENGSLEFKRKEKAEYLLRNGKIALADVFKGSRAELLPFLLGKDNAKTYETLLSRLTRYTYTSDGYARRSFRTKNRTILYFDSACDLLESFAKASASGCTLETYLEVYVRTPNVDQSSEKQPPETLAWQELGGGGQTLAAQLIALALDEKDPYVFKRVKEIVYGDASDGILNVAIIEGILKSVNAEAHKMVGDLLLAAKLQEGLRQMILECADEGSLEGFRYMMNLVIEHNLECFSSVIRSFGTWTGLNLADAKPKAVRKAMEIARAVVADPKSAETRLDSDDLIELYVALWGVGLNEIDDTHRPILKLVGSKQKYKRLAGLYFLSQIDNLPLEKEVALDLLDENDLEVWESLIKRVDNILDAEIEIRKIESGLVVELDSMDEDDEEDGDDEEKDKQEKGEDLTVPETVAVHGLRLSDAEIRKIFNRLCKLAETTPRKETRFEENAFAEFIRRISADEFVKVLTSATVLLGRGDEDVRKMIALFPKANGYTRSNFVGRLLTMKNPLHRSTLIAAFGDPNIYRHRIAEKFTGAELTEEEYAELENALRLKSAEVRRDTIQMLLQRTPEGLQSSIARLLQAKEEQKRLAGLELLDQAEKKGKTQKKYAEIAETCKALAAESVLRNTKKKTSAAEEILVRKIIDEKSGPEYTIENGFGFCDPKGSIDVSPPKNHKQSIREFLEAGIEPCWKILKDFSDLIHKHRDFQYEGRRYSWEKTTESYVLGTADDIYPMADREDLGGRPKILDDYPLADVWKQFLDSRKLSPERVLQLSFYTDICKSVWNFKYETGFEEMGKKLEKWFKDWYLDVCCPFDKLKDLAKLIEKLRYSDHICTLWDIYLRDRLSSTFDIGEKLLGNLYHSLPENRFTEIVGQGENYWRPNALTVLSASQNMWTPFLKRPDPKSENFVRQFKLFYALYRRSGFSISGPSAEILDRARQLNLVDNAELYRELLCRNERCDLMRSVSEDPVPKKDEFPSFRRLLPAVVDRLLGIELRRGDLTTEATDLVENIRHIDGIEYFSRILHALDKEPFTRGYSYGEKSRKDALSSLLGRCRPTPGETIVGKTTLLEPFSEQRLLEAAMYVPEWIDVVQRHLGWKGLTSACWYFHAHVNESMSENKESIIARYSPIASERFKDGAFDLDWFADALKTLGEKHFQMVYDAAKYITSGANHRRAQIFADAARGKLKSADLKKSVREKRNKDNLLAYSLLPMKKGRDGEKEQLERYDFIQTFLKESKKFGAQRKESEGKVCEIALENLARAAGYDDAQRFTWAMETEKSKELARYLKQKKVDGFDLSVVIDDFGKAAIRSVKEDGSELKDVPTKLKKHAYVTELKEAAKIFRDQFRSVRENFEKSMERESDFTADELAGLTFNPAIRQIVSKLVFQAGKNFGFFSDGNLVDVDGKNSKRKLKPAERLTIAHPAHLFEAKLWKAFQKIVFEREIVQPFKQVFRELYLPNFDEKKVKTFSNRYAGHQVQPSKTVALLRNRNWTIDHELGFQKVFYKIDILVRLYCYADWYMPSEIEPPTIERIEFVDRKTMKVIPLQKTPSVVFSEIMRDLDLVVAVAHVGGVDPEASLSTVEMRGVILEETLRLMKIKNVSIKKTHAMIRGSLGEYSVHLGSGEVQMQAAGSLTILPVHSQRRGRLFLPFIDDDPKTAEIVSKTILLAEDDKIKDPTILAAIGG